VCEREIARERTRRREIETQTDRESEGFGEGEGEIEEEGEARGREGGGQSVRESLRDCVPVLEHRCLHTRTHAFAARMGEPNIPAHTTPSPASLACNDSEQGA